MKKLILCIFTLLLCFDTNAKREQRRNGNKNEATNISMAFENENFVFKYKSLKNDPAYEGWNNNITQGRLVLSYAYLINHLLDHNHVAINEYPQCTITNKINEQVLKQMYEKDLGEYGTNDSTKTVLMIYSDYIKFVKNKLGTTPSERENVTKYLKGYINKDSINLEKIRINRSKVDVIVNLQNSYKGHVVRICKKLPSGEMSHIGTTTETRNMKDPIRLKITFRFQPVNMAGTTIQVFGPGETIPE